MYGIALTETFQKCIENTYPYPCMRNPTEYAPWIYSILWPVYF